MEKSQFEQVRRRESTGQFEILEQFSVEQRSVIMERLKVLSVIPKIIGRDFDMPVELNAPKGGWHWDFKDNVVRVDPIDLLEKPVDYLRFVMAHEGGHRRISRTGFIPLEVWQQKGFSFLMNAIEDPRDNNFLADIYPRFREEAGAAYEADLANSAKMKAEAGDKLGYQPRFMQAGLEFIRLWYAWFKREPLLPDQSLPEEVQAVVKKSLLSAEDAWSRYPSRKEIESEQGEKTIEAFAKVAYEIILEEIWPEYQKLVEKDLEDQKTAEYLKGLEQEKQQAKKDEKKKSQSGEAKDGEPAESGAGEKPIPLDSLSPEQREKLRQEIDALSEEQKKELAEKAEKALGEFEQAINKELEGQLSENPEQKAEREEAEKVEKQMGDIEKRDKKADGEKDREDGKKPEEEKQEKEREKNKKRELDKLRSELEKITQGEQSVYEDNRREVQPIINSLTSELRNIFRKRRENKYEAGRKSGRHIDISTRIKEIAKGVTSFDSRAWMRKEAPQEKDYSFTLLVDLSGSMRGEKIAETFKAVIVLAEVLTQLGIKTEILGFNDRLHEYLPFGKKLSKETRDKMSSMLREVSSPRAAYNDDGWAVGEASKRLAKQEEIEKIMIALSDGRPEESSAHGGEEYELKSVIDEIVAKGKEKVIGLGIGSGTNHVSRYYPNSIANVSVEEMAKRLAELVAEVIEGNGKF
ncbi:MAG: VWA domain-containing protein [bacterium]